MTGDKMKDNGITFRTSFVSLGFFPQQIVRRVRSRVSLRPKPMDSQPSRPKELLSPQWPPQLACSFPRSSPASAQRVVNDVSGSSTYSEVSSSMPQAGKEGVLGFCCGFSLKEDGASFLGVSKRMSLEGP